MSYKDITPGTKTAVNKGARFIKSKKGTLGLEVCFEFEEPTTNTRERLNWVAWLSPDAINNSMETLYTVLGFNGSEQTDAGGVLTDPEAFDYKREVSLVIDMETNPETGKEYPRIKWVNSLGGSAFAGVSPQTIKSDLAGVGFRAAFLSAQKNAGKPRAKKKEESTPEFAPINQTDDEQLPW